MKEKQKFDPPYASAGVTVNTPFCGGHKIGCIINNRHTVCHDGHKILLKFSSKIFHFDVTIQNPILSCASNLRIALKIRRYRKLP